MTTAPTQPLPVALSRERGLMDLLRDYAQLTKVRVTTLVVVTAWWDIFLAVTNPVYPCSD